MAFGSLESCHRLAFGLSCRTLPYFDLTQRALRHFLTGSYTVNEMVDLMRSWGLQTRPSAGKPGGPISRTQVYELFKSPFHAGFTAHNGMVRKGSHSPMISVEEFNRIQEILATRRKPRRRRHEH